MNSMSFLEHVIYYIDVFKSPIYFLFNSKIKVPSKFGSFISLTILIFLTVFFFQSDLFQKQKPIASTQSIITTHRPRIDFDYFNMGLAVSVADSNNSIHEDPAIFTITMKILKFNSFGDLLDSDIKELHHCQEEDFVTHGSSFDRLGLKSALCPKTGNMTLEGYWDERITQYVQMMIFTCSNATSNVTCRTPAEIYNYFQDKYMTIYYSDNIIDVNNYKNPLTKTFRMLYFQLDSRMSKKLTLNFKKVVFSHDDGFMFESEKITNSFMLGAKEMDFMSDNQNFTACTVIYSSPETYVVTRRYQRIQEAIANLGGLANFLFWVGYLVTYLEKEFIVFTSIMNKLYVLSNVGEREAGSDNKRVKPNFSTRRILQPRSQKASSVKFEKEMIFPPITDEKKESMSFVSNLRNKFQILIGKIHKPNPNLSMTFCQYIKIRFNPFKNNLNHRERIYDEAFEVYKREMNIVEILNKVHEIDKLKLILMSHKQRKVFNWLAKPVISLKGKKHSMRSELSSKNLKVAMELGRSQKPMKIEKLKKFYQKIKSEGENANFIDRRLIELMDANFE